MLFYSCTRGHSAAGSALGWQPRGQEFDPPCLHHKKEEADEASFFYGEYKGEHLIKSHFGVRPVIEICPIIYVLETIKTDGLQCVGVVVVLPKK